MCPGASETFVPGGVYQVESRGRKDLSAVNGAEVASEGGMLAQPSPSRGIEGSAIKDQLLGSPSIYEGEYFLKIRGCWPEVFNVENADSRPSTSLRTVRDFRRATSRFARTTESLGRNS